jgi:hypothetical protein
MSKKRFTDIDKWEKAWYRKLNPKTKCLWAYLTDRCDQAGVWEADFEAASFYIGDDVSEQDLEAFGERVTPFGDDKYRITGFIDFQYGKLSPNCKAHIPIFKLLEKYGTDPEAVTPQEVIAKTVPIIIKRKLPTKEEVMEELFSNEIYVEGIRLIADGKNIQQAFDECWLYHSSGPNPPAEVWLWKQKFLTWITIKKKDNATSQGRRESKTEGLVERFQKRHSEPD